MAQVLLLSAQDGMLSRLILRGKAGPEERLRFGKLAFGARKARCCMHLLPTIHVLFVQPGSRHVSDTATCMPPLYCCCTVSDQVFAYQKVHDNMTMLQICSQAASTPEEEYRTAAGEMLQESGLPELERRVLGFLCAHSGALKLAATLDDAQRLLHQVPLSGLHHMNVMPKSSITSDTQLLTPALGFNACCSCLLCLVCGIAMPC